MTTARACATRRRRSQRSTTWCVSSSSNSRFFFSRNNLGRLIFVFVYLLFIYMELFKELKVFFLKKKMRGD